MESILTEISLLYIIGLLYYIMSLQWEVWDDSVLIGNIFLLVLLLPNLFV